MTGMVSGSESSSHSRSAARSSGARVLPRYFAAESVFVAIVFSRSFLWQSRLAQSVERELQHRLVFQNPFDGKFGFETARFSHGGFGLVHFALEYVGNGQIEVSVKDAMASFKCPLGVFQRFVETPEAEFSVGAQIEPLAHRWVARTEQHGLLNIGFGLLKPAQIVFRGAARRQQPSG